jgi:hypothetical protein
VVAAGFPSRGRLAVGDSSSSSPPSPLTLGRRAAFTLAMYFGFGGEDRVDVLVGVDVSKNPSPGACRTWHGQDSRF